MRVIRAAAMLLLAAAPAFAAPADAKRIQIVRLESAPKLDDYANGTGPGTAVAGFLQREPGDLTPVSEPTTAFLSFDRDNFYVAFVCKTANPATIRARMSRREAIFDDDFVAVHLDPFQERQRAYMFFSNPIGVQADGVTSEATGDDLSYDTVWKSSGRVTSDGYIVLIAIPFKSLRFPSGTDPSAWGIALQRNIPAHSESAFWPGITRRINGFSSQFGALEGVSGVSPGRNLQVIPYGTVAAARVLDQDTAARATQTDGRAGVDAKVVLHDKVAIDATVNPDFSQVESDEPQVTVNQRFEVFFPEKRPFFLENADYFQTPITLFFSRRVRDPLVGGRVTGREGHWAAGALALDDRYGDHAFDAVVRARRDFSNQSTFGVLVTDRDTGQTSNRVASLDTRIRLNQRWFAEGQALITDDKAGNGSTVTGSGLWAALHRSGRKFTDDLFYQDLSPDVRAPLGFVPQTDIRRLQQFATWRWRPKGTATSFGPNMFLQATWDHAGTPQDWIVRFPFSAQFGQTQLFYRHARMMERFDGIDFHEWENVYNAYTAALKWLTIFAAYSNGTRPNYYPAAGVTPFLAAFTDVSAGATIRPISRLLFDETYLYSRLSQPATSIFNNHIARSKVSYQFTAALSLRGIVDYSAVLPNPSLVSLDRTKHITADILATYLLHPGTAIYVGYTDNYDNLQADGGLHPGGGPSFSTGRQVFVKASYLWRF